MQMDARQCSCVNCFCAHVRQQYRHALTLSRATRSRESGFCLSSARATSWQLLRWAQPASCSAAAALKVSPAASITCGHHTEGSRDSRSSPSQKESLRLLHQEVQQIDRTHGNSAATVE